MPLEFGVIGIDHRHVFGMAENMIAAGCSFKSWWTEGEPSPLEGFRERFPNIGKLDSPDDILSDDELDFIIISCIPSDRAQWAIKAMEAGKDVLVDKPGCVSLEELAQIKATVEKTGRIWAIDFSERFEVPSMVRTAELVKSGAIGRVIQTIGLGPHRLNLDTRPDWFFEREKYGGILADIGSHQIDQFLYLTGSTNAEIKYATVRNHTMPQHPELQDFGEFVIESENGHGYVRVDWFTPNGLPSWGDGRLIVLGSEGYIELRKYVDITKDDGGDHLYLVNGDTCEKIDCSDCGLPFFAALADDIRDRTETAVPQQHTFKATQLAIDAQILAEKGNIS